MGASEATLLNMLNISPFSFGLVIQQVFDNGSIYNPEVLDITEETLHKRFLEVRATVRVPRVLPRCSGSQCCPRRSCRARSSPWFPTETVCQGLPSCRILHLKLLQKSFKAT